MDSEPGAYTQICTVLYGGPPILDANAIGSALRAAGAHQISVLFEAAGHDDSGSIVRGRVRMDGHRVHLISVAEPARDQGIQLALREALLDDGERQLLQGHQGYIQCLYLDGSPNALSQLRALYRIASALVASSRGSSPALGIVDPRALIAHTTVAATALLRWLDTAPPPIALWIRLFAITDRAGDLWLLTRGLTHFRAPELALRAGDVADGEDGESLLMSIASWIVTGAAQVRPGDQLEMMAAEGHPGSSASWRCVAPDSHLTWMDAPFGTILLRPA